MSIATIAVVPLTFRHISRIWNTNTGQCLKTLAEGHDAIWYANNNLRLATTNSCLPANMYNSPLIQNTSYLLPMIVLSDCGIIRARDVLRRMRDM